MKEVNIHTQELIDRINGLSIEDKLIVVRCLDLPLLLSEITRRGLLMEQTLNNLKIVIGDKL